MTFDTDSDRAEEYKKHNISEVIHRDPETNHLESSLLDFIFSSESFFSKEIDSD